MESKSIPAVPLTEVAHLRHRLGAFIASQ
jgi:hypothetical protein